MSTASVVCEPRAPKRERGRQRVAALLEAASAVFAEKGYEAATMTEIASRAGSPIGSLYQFFPVKEALADTLVSHYVGLLAEDLKMLKERCGSIDSQSLIDALFSLMRSHPRERAAALPLAEARMDEHTRRRTFRHMLRRQVAAILRERSPGLGVRTARDMAIVIVQLMKAAGALSDEVGCPRRMDGVRELKKLAVHYIDGSRVRGRPAS